MKKGLLDKFIYKNRKSRKFKKICRNCYSNYKKFWRYTFVRGGKYEKFDGDNFIRTVIWEFPNYEKAIECHKSKEYQAGWVLQKILLKDICK